MCISVHVHNIIHCTLCHAGFTTPAVGALIYEMGPRCANCNNPQALHEVLRQYSFGSAVNTSDDTTVISKPTLNETEVAQLTEVRTYCIVYMCIHIVHILHYRIHTYMHTYLCRYSLHVY